MIGRDKKMMAWWDAVSVARKYANDDNNDKNNAAQMKPIMWLIIITAFFVIIIIKLWKIVKEKELKLKSYYKQL